MLETNFGPKGAWRMQNDYAVTCLTNFTAFEEGTLPIPAELNDFFGADTPYEKRIVFLFEGREFPTYVEVEGEGHHRLAWSKALNSKFIGLFPDYANYFDALEEDDPGSETPLIYFEKIDDAEYLVKLILPSDDALTLKQTLFDFLGPGKSVASFSDSFEMVFLKSYLEQVDNRWRADVFMVAALVQKFYIARINAGKDQDKNAKVRLDNLPTAGLDDVLSFLMENPYMTYADMGIMAMETVEDHFYFTIDNTLIDELSTDDRRLIIEMLDEKIAYYFERMDGPGLQENLTTLMNEYAGYFTKDFRYSFKDVLTESIPGCIGGLSFVPGKRYKVVGFAGEDEWAQIPWVAIMDRKITRFPNTGVTVQYLLNKDTSKLYLALSCGFKKIEADVRKKGVENEKTINMAVESALEPMVAEILCQMDTGSFANDNSEVDLADERYRSGIICYREYVGTVPGDSLLEADLQEMLEVYNLYYERCILKIAPPEPEEAEDEEEEEIAEDEALEEDEEGEEALEEGDADDEEEDEDDEEDAEEDEAEIEETADEAPAPEDDAAEEETPAAAEAPEDTAKPAPAAPVKKKKKTRTKTQTAVQTAAPAAVAAVNDATLKVLKQLLEQTKAPEAPALTKRDRSQKRAEPVKPMPTDVSGTLRQVSDYLVSRGFACGEGTVQNFYLSLKTKPFVLLTGGSSVGKSQFVRLFAEAVGANTENGRFKQVPVRADWKDSRGLLGYLDAAGQFVPGAMPDFVADAVDNPNYPFFLCLDEMASAPIEGYFGEVLSVLETRREEDGQVITDHLLGDERFGRDEEARAYYGDLYLPPNLMIVGTVDNAEARTGISSRVEDRANIMEIAADDLVLKTMPASTPVAQPLGADFMRSEELILAHCTHHREMVTEVVTLLEAMNGFLGGANATIGYKVRDEICFYLLYNAQYGLMSQEKALDHAILQNILPRIRGGAPAVSEVMEDLFKICAGTRADNAIRNYPGTGGLFPLSAKKLSEMAARFDEDGSACFWK